MYYCHLDSLVKNRPSISLNLFLCLLVKGFKEIGHLDLYDFTTVRNHCTSYHPLEELKYSVSSKRYYRKSVVPCKKAYWYHPKKNE